MQILPLQGITAGPSVEGISEYRFANGLKLLLLPDPGKSTITVNMIVGVGAVHENYGETGMAHLLEHMLYKGTPTHPDIPGELKRRGISYNGATWLERTHYYGSFASDPATLEWLLALEADRLVNSNVARSDLDTEMTVVRNEMECGENDPPTVLNQSLRSTTYQWHSYGRRIMGARSDVENVPIERLQAFYRCWYQPDNVTLLVAGDIDPDLVLRLVHTHFGCLERPERELPLFYTEEPAQHGAREINVSRVGDLRLLGLGYHIPAATHADCAALQILAEALAHTPSGRLHKALVEPKLAISVFASIDKLSHPGLATFLAVLPAQGDVALTEQTLLAQIECLAAEPLPDTEIEAAKQRIASDFELAFNNVNEVAILLSQYVACGDWRLWFINRDAAAQVSAADVARVAQAYLQPSNRTLARFIPAAKPQRVEIPVAPAAALLVDGYVGRGAVASGEAFVSTPENITARTEIVALQDSLQVALLPKKTRGAMVTANLQFHFGDEAAITGRALMGHYAGGMLVLGTQTLSRGQIAERFEILKSAVSIGGNAQGAWIVATMPRENLIPVLTLAAEILRDPLFLESEFEQIRERVLTSLEAVRQRPERYADEARRSHFDLWPKGHPHAFRSLDEQLAEVRALRLDDVRAFHRDFYGTAVGEGAVVGDFDAAQLQPVLRTLFSGWRSPQPFCRIAAPYQPVAAVRESFETPDKASALLIAQIVFPLCTSDPDYVALTVANQILGGNPMASRLGERIRQKDGLSYNIDSHLWGSDQDDGGGLSIQASAAPENMSKLESALVEELARFVRDGVSADELDNAREGLLSALAHGRAKDEHVAEILRRNLYLGRTMAWVTIFEQRIRDLTVAKINAVIQSYLHPASLSLFIAGDFAGVKPAPQDHSAGAGAPMRESLSNA